MIPEKKCNPNFFLMEQVSHGRLLPRLATKGWMRDAGNGVHIDGNNGAKYVPGRQLDLHLWRTFLSSSFVSRSLLVRITAGQRYQMAVEVELLSTATPRGHRKKLVGCLCGYPRWWLHSRNEDCLLAFCCNANHSLRVPAAHQTTETESMTNTRLGQYRKLTRIGKGEDWRFDFVDRFGMEHINGTQHINKTSRFANRSLQSRSRCKVPCPRA